MVDVAFRRCARRSSPTGCSPDTGAKEKAARLSPRGLFGTGSDGSELDGHASEVEAADRVIGVDVDVRVGDRLVVQRRLLVTEVVDTDVDARVERLDVVAERHAVIDDRTDRQEALRQAAERT